MVKVAFEVEALGRRESFNKVVNHAKIVSEIVEEIEGKYNIADVLNDLIGQERIENNQVGPIISSLLLDKYDYSVESFNCTQNVTSFEPIAHEISRWNAVDAVIVYFHPELGVTVINPKKLTSWEAVQNLKKNELVNIFAGSVKGNVSDEVKALAIEKCKALLSLQKVQSPAALLKGTLKMKERKAPLPAAKAQRAPVRAKAEKKTAARIGVTVKAAPVQEEKEGQTKMTPFYSIPVTNELFHNGNVEAWKKIIESYSTKYPNTDVYIFYEGERIHDINTLFKWGKVKHGAAILIAVAGNNITDVAKLQRYLRQGASPMFEAFLKFPVNHILTLF